MKISPIVVETVADRLQAAIGVDPRGLDAKRLVWIIQSRCRHLDIPDPSAYPAYLDRTVSEIDALIDEAVVRETRFFRDLTVFDHIRQTAARLAALVSGPLRILSAPCGSGEEAYSLAATMQLAGVPLERFSIDACDISPSALEIARRGVYAERALYHLSAELQQACAQRQGNHWSVHDGLRARVQFERRNLAQPRALGDGPQYHLILCRNLFIYLAPEARAALAQSLSGALFPGGRLFLGTADRVEELNALFSPVRPAASFAFVHRPLGVPVDLQPRASVPVRMAQYGVRIGRPEIALPPAEEGPSRRSEADVTGMQAANDLLQRALDHRQRGELAKAERRCRQALYLSPNLLPALELLQSLWSDQPNLRLRRALRNRVLRNRLRRQMASEPVNWKESP
jgi:chemotaxis protein methyltransferase WspC